MHIELLFLYMSSWCLPRGFSLILPALIIRFVWLHCPLQEDPFISLLLFRSSFFFLIFFAFLSENISTPNKWMSQCQNKVFVLRSFISFRLYCDCRWCDDGPEANVHAAMAIIYFGSALCALACGVWFRLDEADKIILLYNVLDSGDGIVSASDVHTRDALHGALSKPLRKKANRNRREG